MDIGNWLGRLGLGQYVESFRANDIDAEVLPALTADDLQALGVASIGHRRKLMTAIAALRSSSTTAKDAEPADRAERRQVTVMFCDLVGSTELSRSLDPEDMRSVIAAHHRTCASHIGANGGFVAKYMGDGVVAYFGYPVANEHDAENAVRAGLAIATSRLTGPANSPLHVRIGIATGVVVVGDLIGSGPSLERGVVGDTPNLAARLQGVAPPGGVVIAESTRRLIGEFFELQDLGLQALKGLATPLPAFRVLKERAVESRYEALRAGEQTPMVGRLEEIEFLLDRWARAKSGRGQVVWLVGEAGVGKSRLSSALLDSLAGETYIRQRFFGSPQHTDSALHPVIRQILRSIGLKPEDDAAAKLDKLEAKLSGAAASRENAALISTLLSLPSDGRHDLVALPPEIRRRLTLEALLAQLEGLSQQAPLLLIFEDAHWADPSSVEWMTRLASRIEGWRAMLLVTARPEFVPPWGSEAHISALTLDRLPIADVEAMVDRLVGERPLPAHLRKDILERADGVPLFVEEMTKAILEAEHGILGANVLAASPAPGYSVPATLHASLMARLDRSGEAKAVAQIGGALGREFSLALLQEVAGMSEAALTAALDRLVGSGLLIRRGTPLRPTFLFKHALVQDAAYSTLLREPRRALHARIVRAFETKFAEVSANEPELLARHCANAGLIEKAVEYSAKAAERALSRSALKEAVELLRRALSLIESAPLTSALRRERIRLQVALITPLVRVAGQASEAAREAAERASQLIAEAEARGEGPDDPLLLFNVLFATMIAKITAFEGQATLDLAESFLKLAEKQDSSGVRIAFLNFKAQAKFNRGEFEEARALADRSLAMFDPAEHRWLAARFGDDQRVINLAFRSVTLFVMGYPDQAAADATFMLNDAREVGQAATLAFALCYATEIASQRGDLDWARALLDELTPLAETTGMSLWMAQATHCRASLLIQRGEVAEGARLLKQALAGFRAVGATTLEPVTLSALAAAHLALGRSDEALACIREARASIEVTGAHAIEAEVLRIEAEILARGDAALAEKALLDSIAVSARQKAKAWELRAATSLAKLRRDQGRRSEAASGLSPILNWFSEGFQTRDFITASRLMNDLV